MTIANLVWGAPQWAWPAAIMAAILLLLVAWSYARRGNSLGVRLAAGLLKLGGIAALALCLVEPLFSGVRPRPGANLFLLLADNSQSMQLRDQGQRQTRSDQLQRQLERDAEWYTRLSQDFEVRRYLFDTRLRPVADYSQLAFDGNSSSLGTALASIATRYHNRPTAGALLLTDGNATDWEEEALEGLDLPPIYPVVIGREGPAKDISVTRVSVSQSNFEAAPVTILAEVDCKGYTGETIVLQLLDEEGEELQRQRLTQLEDQQPLVHRFRLRPEQSGVTFYQVRAMAAAEEKTFDQADKSAESTRVNNTRMVAVDRGGGPYRVLYVSGRPNWDFKFLRRALAHDDEVDLVGLIRVAKREPKFTFRGHMGEDKNPLFRGFDNQEDEEAEHHDQPVLLRLGTRDEVELRDGFPKAADQLFRYHALILDDLEADFFNQDQMSLVQKFVSRRGGGFLMLGGRDAFAGGQYARTPIGELLPVYADPPREEPSAESYRLLLTREGWIQPWVRLRTTEQGEEKRLAQMPGFQTMNRIRTIKPGATVLAQVAADSGAEHPALVAQRFGKGQSAAILIGDLWRWQLRGAGKESDDLQKAWRQTLRWLVSDVPQRLDVQTRRKRDEPGGTMEIVVSVRDEEFQPLDNASVTVTVQTPDERNIELTAAPSEAQAGQYVTSFTAREPGAYRAEATARGPDGREVGRRSVGWTAQPAAEEFQTLSPDRALLERIAERTGGELVQLDDLNEFVDSLPNRKIPVTEPWIYPLWHRWSVLLFAVGCLVGEWGLRRWKGLP